MANPESCCLNVEKLSQVPVHLARLPLFCVDERERDTLVSGTICMNARTGPFSSFHTGRTWLVAVKPFTLQKPAICLPNMGLNSTCQPSCSSKLLIASTPQLKASCPSVQLSSPWFKPPLGLSMFATGEWCFKKNETLLSGCLYVRAGRM